MRTSDSNPDQRTVKQEFDSYSRDLETCTEIMRKHGAESKCVEQRNVIICDQGLVRKSHYQKTRHRHKAKGQPKGVYRWMMIEPETLFGVRGMAESRYHVRYV